MKSTVLYIALCVLVVDLVNAKSIKMNIFRETRNAAKPKPKPQPSAKPGPGPGPGPGPVPRPGQMPPPMPGQMPGQMQGGGQMGGPECGGCAQSQEPKQCPAICMKWNTIIKPNGEIENGPSSITPLAANEKVGTNGVFPPMSSMMRQPMMPQQQPMIPGAGMPFAGVPSQGAPPPGVPSPGGQPPPGPPPAQGATTPTPNEKPSSGGRKTY